MTDSKRRALSLGLLLLAIWALASWIRLRALGGATAGSDATGQYLSGLSLGRGALPAPPNPEGGHSLWLTVWPLVQVANSLEQLYILRFILGASVAPLAASSAWLLSPAGPPRWIAATLAGLLLALDPGLVDTLVIAFRGYGAPEWVGLATLFGALTLRGHSWALAGAGISLVGAAGQHPMGTGMLVGGLCALPWFVRGRGDPRLKWALILTGIAALPRLWIIRRQADCGQPAMDCLRQVALGSSESGISSQQMLERAFHDRFSVELLGLWPLFLLGLLALLLPLSRWVGPSPIPRVELAPQPSHSRALLAFALCGVLGILLVGGAVDSLRPYHLRIGSVPLAVATAVGLSRLWPLAVAAGLWAVLSWGPREIMPPGPVQPSTFDALAQHLEEIPEPIWVDSVYLESPVGLDPAAVVLAAVLQGQDPDRFNVQGDPSIVLIVNGQPQTGLSAIESQVLAQGEDWAMIRFDNHSSASQWIAMQQAPAAPTGGAWDWLKVLHPVGTDLAETDW